MRAQIKTLCWSTPVIRDLLAIRRDRQMWTYFRSVGVVDLNERLERLLGATVISGPFAGMHYRADSSGSVAGPKMIGCYEAELHGALEHLIATQPDLVIDLGCAEGYIAVGLSRRLPSATIVASDINPLARRQTRELASRNAVSGQVKVCGRLSARALQRMLEAAGRPWIVCDIEGAESDVLSPSRIPALRTCSMIVEEHSHIVHGVDQLLAERFESSHEIIRITQTERRAMPWLSHVGIDAFSSDERMRLIDEMRVPTQGWLLLKALAS